MVILIFNGFNTLEIIIWTWKRGCAYVFCHNLPSKKIRELLLVCAVLLLSVIIATAWDKNCLNGVIYCDLFSLAWFYTLL